MSHLEFNLLGAALTWTAYQKTQGISEVIQLYQITFENAQPSTNDGRTVETVGRCFSYLIHAAVAIATGGYVTGTAEAKFRGQRFVEHKVAVLIFFSWWLGMFALMCLRYKRRDVVPTLARRCAKVVAFACGNGDTTGNRKQGFRQVK